MIVLDTNILIEILKAEPKTIQKVKSFEKPLAISSITVMELYYGALNKNELKKLENFVNLFEIIHLNENISRTSTKLIKKYAKSHTIDIPDSLIASTTIEHKSKLFTYNLKDFKYIEGLELV